MVESGIVQARQGFAQLARDTATNERVGVLCSS
jgi:hypothetical protein